jgi:hypothetical protein
VKHEISPLQISILLSLSSEADRASQSATLPPDAIYSIVVLAGIYRVSLALRVIDMDGVRFISAAVIRCDLGTILKNPVSGLRPWRVAALYISTVPGGPGTNRPSRLLLNDRTIVSPTFLASEEEHPRYSLNHVSWGSCERQQGVATSSGHTHIDIPSSRTS